MATRKYALRGECQTVGISSGQEFSGRRRKLKRAKEVLPCLAFAAKAGGDFL